MQRAERPKACRGVDCGWRIQIAGIEALQQRAQGDRQRWVVQFKLLQSLLMRADVKSRQTVKLFAQRGKVGSVTIVGWHTRIRVILVRAGWHCNRLPAATSCTSCEALGRAPNVSRPDYFYAAPTAGVGTRMKSSSSKNQIDKPARVLASACTRTMHLFVLHWAAAQKFGLCGAF